MVGITIKNFWNVVRDAFVKLHIDVAMIIITENRGRRVVDESMLDFAI